MYRQNCIMTTSKLQPSTTFGEDFLWITLINMKNVNGKGENQSSWNGLMLSKTIGWGGASIFLVKSAHI